MKIIPAISLLLNLAVLSACRDINTQSSDLSHNESCPQNQLCETMPIPIPGVINSSIPNAVPAVGSRYYYVSHQGDDNNSGTKGLPFRTIGKAAKEAEAGDVVLITAGIYYEDVIPQHSGEPDRYIIYQNAGDGEVIIDANGGERAGCIEIGNKGYLKFIGLTVRGANSFLTWPRAGISMTDGANHIILENITAYDNYFGILAYGQQMPVSFISVKNSKTFSPEKLGNIHYGIFFYKKVYDSSIVNNHIAYTLPETQSYGIEIATDFPGDQSNGPRRIVVTGNEVDYNESEGIHTWNAVGILISDNYLHHNGATGIQIEDGSENIVIEGNLSENNAQKYEFEAGVWIDGSKNVVVRRNILRKNKVGLIITSSDRVIVHDNYVYLNNRGAENLNNAAGLIVEDSTSNITVTHTTFFKNGADGTQHGSINFGLFHPSCRNITFKNNIIAETANVLELFHDSCANFVADFNNYYNTRPLEFLWNQKQLDWPAYQTETGQDIHSLTTNPDFVDPAGYNFSLQSESPLIDHGTVLAWTTSPGRGDTLTVTDASYFSDGFGIGKGDSILVDGNLVNILSIDYMNRSIKIDRVLNWNENKFVSFPFTGIAPVMGVNEVR